MRKLLIGPALTGIGYAAGSYYGADAEQLVHKSPDVVQAAVEQAISDRTGTMELEGGKPIAYETKVEEGADGQVVMRLMFGEREAALAMLQTLPGARRKTLAADKGYDTRDFIAGCRARRTAGGSTARAP